MSNDKLPVVMLTIKPTNPIDPTKPGPTRTYRIGIPSDGLSIASVLMRAQREMCVTPSEIDLTRPSLWNAYRNGKIVNSEFAEVLPGDSLIWKNERSI